MDQRPRVLDFTMNEYILVDEMNLVAQPSKADEYD